MKAPTTIQIHSPLSYCWLTAGAGTWWWPQTAVGICVVARVISATRQTQSAAHETPPCETSPAKSPNCKDAWLASFADHVEHSPLDSQDGTPQATSEMIARDDGALAPTSLTVHTVTPCKINYVWQRITTCERDLPPTTRPFIKTPATLLDSQPPHPIAPHVGSVSSIDPPAGAGTGTEPRSCSTQAWAAPNVAASLAAALLAACPRRPRRLSLRRHQLIAHTHHKCTHRQHPMN